MFEDRIDAGQQLAKTLRRFKGDDAVVLALPRGGVTVAAEVANGLEAPLGLVLVQKIGHPSHLEYTIDAIAEDEEPVFNTYEAALMGRSWLDQAEISARQRIAELHTLYCDEDFEQPDITDKLVILVDDAISNGLTMEAVATTVQNKHPRYVVIATPIASYKNLNTLEGMADEVVALQHPKPESLTTYYHHFERVTDEEAAATLKDAAYQALSIY